jgi:uncharacterized protein YjbI with pentapeptide repeats
MVLFWLGAVLGAAELSAAELGAAELGAAELGAAELGAAELGAAELGADVAAEPHALATIMTATATAAMRRVSANLVIVEFLLEDAWKPSWTCWGLPS